MEARGSRSQSEIQAIWDDMPQPRRHYRWRTHYRYHDSQRTSVAIPPSDAQGGVIVPDSSTPPRPPKQQSRKYPERTSRISRKLSEDLLAFRLEHSPGCSIPGCPLAPSDQEGGVLLGLLEHDHIERHTKRAVVGALTGEARADEVRKTQCLCLWHHFTRTRDQRRFRTTSMLLTAVEATPSKRAVALWKELVGCEHPLHAVMPWSTLVPDGSDSESERVYAFMDVSHVVRCREYNGAYHSIMHMEDLLSEKAVIHCKFCHAMYSLCEKAAISPAPFSTHQYELLKRRHPEFVAHFHESTKGFDWQAEKERMRARAAAGVERRRLSRKKRKKRSSDAQAL